MKIKKIIKNWRVIILIIFLIFALIAIRPSPWVEGVTIRNVISNSSASEAGFTNPKPSAAPLGKERIIFLNSQPITSVEDYYQQVSELKPNRTIHIKTNKQLYTLTTRPDLKITELNETITKTISKIIQTNQTVNGSTVVVNQTVNETVEVPKTKTEVLGTQDLGLKVYESPISNIREGLDLAGGTRVLLKPENEISRQDLTTIIDNLKERLNVYGLGDIVVKEARDLSGDYYILVEIAGATEEEVRGLLAKQGKFEAKIGNETVFVGGQNDIPYVCRSAECSGLDPYRSCGQLEDGSWVCNFFFAITLSPEAAKKHAQITQDLEIIIENNKEYLSQDLVLFLDDKEVDKLKIGAELRGSETKDIQISGSGVGQTQQEASNVAIQNMKRLQTILVTGSLPVKLEIVKMETVSPVLGKEFLKNAIFVGLLAIIGVTLVFSLRYRKIKVVAPMALTMVSELVLILGFAALVGWNLDLAAIAGIIIAIGTGVDHLIIITDETLRGEATYNWKKKIKQAMFIIIGAYLTTLVGMIPLWFAGAGLLKGFAFTTIVGISFGVLIARPAYAAVIEILLKE